jgi:hypothetical protein
LVLAFTRDKLNGVETTPSGISAVIVAMAILGGARHLT